MRHLLTGFLLVAICSIQQPIFAASNATDITFKIGDQAPLVEPLTWLRGNPVVTFDTGRVYVLEFWATWCPPCITTIPHLSALQRKHQNSLTIIGINAEGLLGFEAKVDTVREFMKKHGKDMAYSVAMEDPIKRSISEKWVTGTGTYGAPTAGIIDQHGNLVWIGYPSESNGYTFDQALEDTLVGKIDLDRSHALQTDLSQKTAKYWANKSHNSP